MWLASEIHLAHFFVFSCLASFIILYEDNMFMTLKLFKILSKKSHYIISSFYVNQFRPNGKRKVMWEYTDWNDMFDYGSWIHINNLTMAIWYLPVYAHFNLRYRINIPQNRWKKMSNTYICIVMNRMIFEQPSSISKKLLMTWDGLNTKKLYAWIKLLLPIWIGNIPNLHI